MSLQGLRLRPGYLSQSYALGACPAAARTNCTQQWLTHQQQREQRLRHEPVRGPAYVRHASVEEAGRPRLRAWPCTRACARTSGTHVCGAVHTSTRVGPPHSAAPLVLSACSIFLTACERDGCTTAAALLLLGVVCGGERATITYGGVQHGVCVRWRGRWQGRARASSPHTQRWRSPSGPLRPHALARCARCWR